MLSHCKIDKLSVSYTFFNLKQFHCQINTPLLDGYGKYVLLNILQPVTLDPTGSRDVIN